MNVLTDPWIPVLTDKGERNLVNMKDFYRHAEHYRQIIGASPMEEFAVCRFLSAFGYAAYHPKDSYAAEDIFSLGHFPTEPLDAYIRYLKEEKGQTFELFDEEHPFLQVPRSAFPEKKESISRLSFLRTPKSGVPYSQWGFTQTYSVTPAEAFRLLLVHYTYAIHTAPNFPSGPNLSTIPTFILPQGKNLFETILFSMPFGAPYGEKLAGEAEVPLWERNDAFKPASVLPSVSVLLGMVFPSRQLSLLPPGPDGRVRFCNYVPGYGISKDFSVWLTLDPHNCSFTDAKGQLRSVSFRSFPEDCTNAYAFLTGRARKGTAGSVPVTPCLAQFRKHLIETDEERPLSASFYLTESDPGKANYKHMDKVAFSIPLAALAPENWSYMADFTAFLQENIWWQLSSNFHSFYDSDAGNTKAKKAERSLFLLFRERVMRLLPAFLDALREAQGYPEKDAVLTDFRQKAILAGTGTYQEAIRSLCPVPSRMLRETEGLNLFRRQMYMAIRPRSTKKGK